MPNRRYPLYYLTERQRRNIRAREMNGRVNIEGLNEEVEEDVIDADANPEHPGNVFEDNEPIEIPGLEDDVLAQEAEDVLPSDSDFDLDSSEDELEDFDFLPELARWASDGVSMSKTKELLCLLKRHHCFQHIPSDPRTLLKCPRSIPVQEIGGGKYCHIGIRKNLTLLIQKNPGILDCEKIRLQCSIDGLPLAKSSGSQAWPIQVCLEDFPTIPPFVVGIFHGYEKPRSCEEYLGEYVEEMSLLKAEGVEYGNITKEVEVTAYICDAPARAFAAQIKSHSGYFGCGKCCIQGEFFNNRMIFNEIHAPLRTDESFCLRSDEDHHIGNSPLERIPGTLMVTHFPMDYMHLVCLGVMRKLLLAWLKGSLNVRLPARKLASINDRTAVLAISTPSDFARRPRSLQDLMRWKATEFRTFLAYTGPFLLKGILSQSAYKHFLSLHYAIRVLLSENYRNHVDYSKQLLEYFVSKCEGIYGRDYLSYNVHGLIHLVEDSKVHGPLDMFSAFKFENHLYQIKKLVRKPNLPLPQIVKRLHERSYFHHMMPLKKNQKCRSIPEDVPFRLEAPYYTKYCHKSFVISAKPPNNCVISKTGEIIVISFLGSRNDDVLLVGRSFQKVQIFYDIPAPSVNVGVFSASNLGDNQLWSISDIQSKAFQIASLWGDDEFYVVELLHH